MVTNENMEALRLAAKLMNETGVVRYPEIVWHVDIDSPDGNIYAIMGGVSHRLRVAGVSEDIVQQYKNEVLASGSYQEALDITKSWIGFTTQTGG